MNGIPLLVSELPMQLFRMINMSVMNIQVFFTCMDISLEIFSTEKQPSYSQLTSYGDHQGRPAARSRLLSRGQHSVMTTSSVRR